MLLRFTVENVLCFNTEASLSMIASPDDRHPSHVIAASTQRRPAALRAAALYGANGHGKSNFVNAIIAMRRLVVRQEWKTHPFKLDAQAPTRPSRLVAEFRHEGFDYEYGLAVIGKTILEEWLFRTDKGNREHMLFERTTSRTNDGFKTRISAGPLLRNSASPAEGIKMGTYLDVFASGMKETRPFLSEAYERGIDLIKPAYLWFDEILTPIAATASYAPLFERSASEESFRHFLEDFVKQCDVGIKEIKSNTIEIDGKTASKFPEDIRSSIEELDDDGTIHIGGPDGHVMVIDHDDDGNVILREMSAIRNNIQGDPVEFGFDEESSGTRRILDLAPMLFDLDEKKVYIVDELDRKLHPLLAYQFVKAFLDNTDLQLIFTTHNTHLMSLDLLRRDEVWFIQKRPDGSSDLYSLAELKIRPDLNIKKGYLSGRFGAIPFLGNVADLGWTSSLAEPNVVN
ncbi:ATP/GTP-binding protein [Sphingobium yanoikuyae]|uniref:ATP/GTP-binding protein n=1 Tax=Sphingobium yanoikuyae TaxID=13690 RepID=UPI0035C72464